MHFTTAAELYLRASLSVSLSSSLSGSFSSLYWKLPALLLQTLHNQIMNNASGLAWEQQQTLMFLTKRACHYCDVIKRPIATGMNY